MRTFLEGVEAVRLPCTLAILVPAVLLVIASGRRALVAFVGFVLGASAIAWARFANLWFDDPGSLTAVLLGVAIAALGIAVWRLGPSRPEVVGPIAIAFGGITAWLWRPCVGRQLGDILNNAPDAPAAEILPTLAYIAGTSLIAAAVVLVPHAWPRMRSVVDSDRVRNGAFGLIVLLGVAIATGVYEDLVAELLRRSTI